ncbi:MAG: UvrD-helicase domain-containing protein, partial [Acidimicrobiales bacterium]
MSEATRGAPLVAASPVGAGDPGPLDVCGPLPTGLTLLEASAGTGKTFTIASLVARYVAAGLPIEELLVVTFTRLATGELRSRVRDRLVEAEAALRLTLTGRPAQAGGGPGGGDDRLMRFLAAGSPAEVEVRRHRLSVALADFDAATIATTHGFCEHVLAGLGTAGDVERDVVFEPDPAELIEEVVDDLYLRKFVGGADVAFTRAEALQIARAALTNPDASIEPVDAGDQPGAGLRAGLARAVRREVRARKLATGVLGYEDLLTRLADTLRSAGGDVACRRLRDRYKVALVDEFQDT